jgi:hypothetical protein
MLAARRTVQPALQLGVAVSYAEHCWMARKATVWSCWHSACSIYAAAHWTDLRSYWHRQSSTINRQRNAAGRQRNQHKVLAMSAVPVVLHSAWSLCDSGIRDAVEESVCLSGAGRQHSNPHARRRLDARGAGLSVSEELAMLVCIHSWHGA